METTSNLQLKLLRLYGNGVSDESLREIKTASGLMINKSNLKNG